MAPVTSIPLHKHVALLIDADNVPLGYLEPVMKLAEYYGKLQLCRAYGDWKQAPLSSWCEQLDRLQIDRRQVDRVGKNATDHGLLIDAGEILGSEFYENGVQVFVIVSGDGDFTSACKIIQEKGKQVVGFGSRQGVSDSLQKSCDKFYFLEDLEEELSNLEKLHLISPREAREFFHLLFFAYHQLTKKNDWVSYSQLGEKLRELVPDFESKFGKYKLSQWLRSFDQDFESYEQTIRRIDPDPEYTRFSLIVRAYLQAKDPDGLASLGQLGKKLRELDSNYESRFGTKKLSKWLEDYPNQFRTYGNCVIHRDYWKS